MRAITLSTENRTRNVTIAYSEKDKEFRLLGILPHMTKLDIDQDFIDNLQEAFNKMVQEEVSA